MLADHDAELLDALLADREFAFAGEQEIAEEGGGDRQRAEQRDDDGEEVGAAADHPGNG